jgi:hypothetical protein
MLLSSVAEMHHFGGTGAGAATRCGAGSDRSGFKHDTVPVFNIAVIQSRIRKEPHNFGGARAVTRCCSGSDGSKLNVLHKWIIKHVTKCNSFFTFPIHICNHFDHTKIGGISSLSPLANFGLVLKSWIGI